MGKCKAQAYVGLSYPWTAEMAGSSLPAAFSLCVLELAPHSLPNDTYVSEVTTVKESILVFWRSHLKGSTVVSECLVTWGTEILPWEGPMKLLSSPVWLSPLPCRAIGRWPPCWTLEFPGFLIVWWGKMLCTAIFIYLDVHERNCNLSLCLLLPFSQSDHITSTA